MYIGVSAGKFDEMIKDGRMPGPRRIDARRVWDIRALDLAFDDLPDETAPANNSWDDMYEDGVLVTSKREPRAGSIKNSFNSELVALAEGWSIEEWTADVRASPLNRREMAVLRLLGPRGDVVVPWREIKGGGPGTMGRLVARGFVTAIEREPGRTPDYQLTNAGREAWIRLPDE